MIADILLFKFWYSNSEYQIDIQILNMNSD